MFPGAEGAHQAIHHEHGREGGPTTWGSPEKELAIILVFKGWI